MRIRACRDFRKVPKVVARSWNGEQVSDAGGCKSGPWRPPVAISRLEGTAAVHLLNPSQVSS